MCQSQTASPRGVFTATVVRNEKLCSEHYLLTLAMADFPPTTAGQFVQLQCRPVIAQASARLVDWPAGQLPKFTQAELVDGEPILRRPFSLAGRRNGSDGVELDIIYRVVGVGTGWLAGAKAGVRLSLIGPLGNGLAVQPDKTHALLVGGGVGIPPMMYLAESLVLAGKQVVAFNGVSSDHLLPLKRGSEKPLTGAKASLCCEPFKSLGVRSVIASDDGTVGFHGLVTDALAGWLEQADFPAERGVCYSCGPEPMMRAVGELCIALGIECYLSLERNMACGMGTCQSCVVKIRDNSEQGWSYKLCCADGPVFAAETILW